MEPPLESNVTLWPFPFTQQDWEQTPPAVQAYLRTLHHEMGQLHERVESLEARLQQDSTTSSRPPSSDSPYQKPRRRTASSIRPPKGGGKPGHAGHRQVLLVPTHVEDVKPEWCACGRGDFDLIEPYYTHQEIELPPIEVEVTPWVLHQGRCLGCGRWHKAQVPGEHVTGYGPRLSALRAELAGTYGNGRRMVQTFCSSVLGVPISLGAIQKVLDRVT
jgi:transposase